MKKWISTLTGLILGLSISWINAAQTPLLIPAAPELNSQAYVLMDANSGRILAQKNMNTRRPPASLTKLMTLYLTADAIKHGQISLNDTVKISKLAWKTGGSRMFVKVGSEVPVHNLVEGVIVASGNDACMALAQYVGGNIKTFVKMMNQAAHYLGMKNTHYTDPTGLPAPNHYSSAHDLALLTRAIIHDFPTFYKTWFKQKWITWNHIRQPNRNRLLWRDPTVDGLKTGHTKEAGYCLIASAERHGMRLISVVMGTPTDEARNDDAEALLNYGFRFFNTVKLFDAGQTVTQQRIWFGEKNKIGFGLKAPLYLTIAKGEKAHLATHIAMQKPLKAPIIKGTNYGQIHVTLGNKSLATASLFALQNDDVAGSWSRLIDHIRLFFHHTKT